jgi:hypothetical protein
MSKIAQKPQGILGVNKKYGHVSMAPMLHIICWHQKLIKEDHEDHGFPLVTHVLSIPKLKSLC